MIEQLTGALLRFVEGNVGALLRKEMRNFKKDKMEKRQGNRASKDKDLTHGF